MNVLDAAVRWNPAWMNLPSLHFLIEGEGYTSPFVADGLWQRLPVSGPCRPCRTAELRSKPLNPGCERCGGSRVEEYGNMYLAHAAPFTRFVFESRFGGGACGLAGALIDGTPFKTDGGWLGSEGSINDARLTDERFAAILPEPIVAATYHIGTWDNVGMFGLSFDLSFCREQIARFLPGVELVEVKAPASLQSDANQAMVAADTSGPYYVPYPQDAEARIASGELSRRGKPSADSDLYLATAEEEKTRQARNARYARPTR